ncbi:penicillin-binding protein 2 [Bacillus sp. D386]|uniref:peptidoglycan D,D-transpeptidase FtsI family protein n=1 Tax=Bacillus sp. D386 TaxID=2587155 RepID=UPI001122EEF0|nr:penicillin-binding transpeptidase domain-containing protein [Bacillus sp. D386]
MKKRILGTGIIFLFLFTLLIAKLVHIQIVKPKEYSKHRVNLLENSVRQRIDEITLDDGRGGFLDREGKSISYQDKSVLVLFPFVKHLDWPADKVADILEIEKEILLQRLKSEEEPFIYENKGITELTDSQIAQINNLHIPGIIGVKKREVIANPSASHLLGSLTLNKNEIDEANKIGYTPVDYQTKVGKTGLQKAFQIFLQGNGSKKLVYHKAANGLPMFGVDIRYLDEGQSGERINIQTTLDQDYQKLAEQVADDSGLKKGGIIILDVETNDILTMFSTPLVNKDVNNEGNHNQMITPQTPGSVFKTVIAAAAIEEGLNLNGREFNGNLDHLGRPVDKNTGRLLGMVDFKRGFALSSNQVFGVLGKELADKNPNLIEEYAERLGLIQPIGWNGSVFHTSLIKQLPEEKSGVIWTESSMKKDENFVANTSIGQLNVKVTPLAIANMMATIARGGERMMARAATKAVDDDGLTIATFKEQPIEGKAISKITASKLQQLLRGVVTTTGKYATAGNLHTAKYDVAGKSGTAEIGAKEDKTKQMYNKWFAGYFPFQKPKYAMVIVNLDTASKSGAVTPLYLQMVNGIHAINQKRGLE